MNTIWKAILDAVDRRLPVGTPARKLLQLVGIILIFEGMSVLILYSYFGVILGAVSVVVGVFLVLILSMRAELQKVSKTKQAPGIRLVEILVNAIGGKHVMMLLGVLVIVLVLAYNQFLSTRSELGDMDTLAILFGGILIAYPFLVDKFKPEASFTLLFIAFVMVFLVVPQVVSSPSSDTGTSTIGNLYVHYMLAVPFAGILDIAGIPSSSSGSYVTIQFHDGTVHTLGISSYCAGLYSFTIFVAAFFAFVLIFERLPTKVLTGVLALGILIAYAGNILRMVIIGVVGYYNGMEALLWAHKNVGWIIFLSWSAVFWYFLLGYVSKRTIERNAA